MTDKEIEAACREYCKKLLFTPTAREMTIIELTFKAGYRACAEQSKNRALVLSDLMPGATVTMEHIEAFANFMIDKDKEIEALRGEVSFLKEQVTKYTVKMRGEVTRKALEKGG